MTETHIVVEDAPGELEPTGTQWSCRLSAHEACAWAMKRLGEEMEQSVRFYRTGKPTDSIVID
jgi:hypothetical protein